MPIREFMCPKCMMITEKLIFSGEREIAECIKCGRELENKILSAPSRFDIHGYSESNGYAKKVA